MFVDPPFHRVDVRDGGEVEMAAPDEGPDLGQEGEAEGDVAGDRAGLEHGRALPVLAHALVIGDGGGQGDAGRRGGRVGAQAQIDAKNIAIGVARFHQCNKVAREAAVEGAGRVAVVDTRIGVLQQNEVDIAGVVEFACAELAHAEDGEAAAEFRCGRRGQVQRAGVMAGEQQMGDAEAQRGLGEVGQCRGDFFQRPDAADIGDGGGQSDDALGLAQAGGDAAARCGRSDGGEVGHGAGDDGVGAVPHGSAQGGGFAQGEFGEIGRVSAERAQYGGSRAVGEARLGAAKVGKPFAQPGGGDGILRLGPGGVWAARYDAGSAHRQGWP